MDAPELQPLLGPFLDAYAALHPGMAPGDRAHATLDLAKYPPRHIDQVLLQRDAFVPLQAAVILDEPDADGTLASDHYGVLARFRVVAAAPDRSEERRVGKAWVSPFRSRWSPDN